MIRQSNEISSAKVVFYDIGHFYVYWVIQWLMKCLSVWYWCSYSYHTVDECIGVSYQYISVTIVFWHCCQL